MDRFGAAAVNKYGPMFVSAVVLFIYAGRSFGLGRGVLGEGEVQLLNTCLTIVLAYWLGSSSGSVAKSEQLEGKK